MFGPEFTNVSEIGRGAFSTVYRARSTVFHREVAIKHFSGRLTDPRLASAFDRECAVIGSLSHHINVVTVYGTGRTQDDRPYIIMQHFPLGSVADIVERDGILSLPEIVYVASAIGSALSLAHADGVLHRDVKPHNILADAPGHIALADFGIARPDTPHVTTSVMSTHAFAAPEVLRDGRADIRSDVYSLAATLYWLLTGQPPHAVVPGESEFRYLQRIIDEPSDALPATLPIPVVAAIQAALSRNASDRPASIDAFADLLVAAALNAGVTPATALTGHAAPLATSSHDAAPDYAAETMIRPSLSASPSSARRRSLLVCTAIVPVVAAIALGLAFTRDRSPSSDQTLPAEAAAHSRSAFPSPTMLLDSKPRPPLTTTVSATSPGPANNFSVTAPATVPPPKVFSTNANDDPAPTRKTMSSTSPTNQAKAVPKPTPSWVQIPPNDDKCSAAVRSITGQFEYQACIHNTSTGWYGGLKIHNLTSTQNVIRIFFWGDNVRDPDQKWKTIKHTPILRINAGQTIYAISNPKHAATSSCTYTNGLPSDPNENPHVWATSAFIVSGGDAC